VLLFVHSSHKLWDNWKRPLDGNVPHYRSSHRKPEIVPAVSRQLSTQCVDNFSNNVTESLPCKGTRNNQDNRDMNRTLTRHMRHCSFKTKGPEKGLKGQSSPGGKGPETARPIDSFVYHMTQQVSHFGDRIMKVSVIMGKSRSGEKPGFWDRSQFLLCRDWSDSV